MRQFVVLGHTAPTDPDFSLDDLAGAAGRLDVLCRCVNAAFFLSHAIRDDVQLFLVLQDGVTIRFEGEELRRLYPDERNIAGSIRHALEAKTEAVGHQEVESAPGISISKRGLESVLKSMRTEGILIQLHEDGSPLVDLAPPTQPTFVLSDHHEFTEAEETILATTVDNRVTLSPEVLHADHAITVAHNYLDTDGYVAY